MIKPNELRVGNWVNGEFANGELKPFQIFRIDGNDDCSGLEPIPLTPEILEKCVFEYVDHYTCIINGWVFKKAFGGGLIFHFDVYNSPKNRQVTIRYLHQLQNLYFAGTGEELEINL
jgi:hypothetical protein